MISNIKAVYDAATSYEVNEGMEWYRGDAWVFCLNLGWEVASGLGQLSREIEDRHWAKFVAAVVAVTSPQKEWRVNKALAAKCVEDVVAGRDVTGHYPAQCAKVAKLYRYFLFNRGIAFDNKDVLNIISKGDAKKTRNFYLNICGDYSVVTVDGHASLLADNGLKRIAITKASQPSGAKYDAYADEYRTLAHELGIEPAQLQAITWVTYRRMALVEGV